MKYDLTERATPGRLQQFADELIKISNEIGFKVSSRGWCYQMEQAGMITKAEFDRVESLINKCRKTGILPIDFTAEEEGRQFSGVETPDPDSPIEYMRDFLDQASRAEYFYTPDWWHEEEYYIQMVVEKIDLKTLFEPVCKKYHIPIATSKGWSSMLQRATYAKRFQEAEERGLQPVLLYCGDHDPDGLRISEFLRKNLADLKDIEWEDGTSGYDPSGLRIIRFGLNKDFIVQHNLSWIDNLITGSGKNLASPAHKNHHMEYVQEYIGEHGKRKCEANAIVPKPKIAGELVESAITEFLGPDARERFQRQRDKVVEKMKDFKERTGLGEALRNALEMIDNEEGDDDDE